MDSFCKKSGVESRQIASVNQAVHAGLSIQTNHLGDQGDVHSFTAASSGVCVLLEEQVLDLLDNKF